MIFFHFYSNTKLSKLLISLSSPTPHLPLISNQVLKVRKCIQALQKPLKLEQKPLRESDSLCQWPADVKIFISFVNYHIFNFPPNIFTNYLVEQYICVRMHCIQVERTETGDIVQSSEQGQYTPLVQKTFSGCHFKYKKNEHSQHRCSSVPCFSTFCPTPFPNYDRRR